MESIGSPSLDAIAAATGTTAGEVALAIAADPRLDPAMRFRITTAAQDAGYRPLALPHERLGRPLRLALVFRAFRGDDPDANRFYALTSASITAACVNAGSRIESATITVDGGCRLGDIPAPLRRGACDAAFVFGVEADADDVARLRREACPIVLVDGYAAGSAFDFVHTDDAIGARAIVERLVAAGHREIAMLGSEPICHRSIEHRRRGYVEALRAHGLKSHFVDVSCTLTRAAAVIGVDYLRRHPEVTAVFGANDLVSVAFMEVARDAGYRIPADVSLVGFEDIDLASLVLPALTTVNVDRQQLARAAFSLLAYRLEHPEAPALESFVEPRLVDRDSISSPRPRRG